MTRGQWGAALRGLQGAGRCTWLAGPLRARACVCVPACGGGHGGEAAAGPWGSVSVGPVRRGPRGSGCSNRPVFSSQGSPEAAAQGRDPPAGAGAAPRGGKRAAPGEAGALQPAKLSRAELYKPPTSEELSQLKETEDLFHSSLLRLQVSREARRPGEPPLAALSASGGKAGGRGDGGAAGPRTRSFPGTAWGRAPGPLSPPGPMNLGSGRSSAGAGHGAGTEGTGFTRRPPCYWYFHCNSWYHPAPGSVPRLHH